MNKKTIFKKSVKEDLFGYEVEEFNEWSEDLIKSLEYVEDITKTVSEVKEILESWKGSNVIRRNELMHLIDELMMVGSELRDMGDTVRWYAEIMEEKYL